MKRHRHGHPERCTPADRAAMAEFWQRSTPLSCGRIDVDGQATLLDQGYPPDWWQQERARQRERIAERVAAGWVPGWGWRGFHRRAESAGPERVGTILRRTVGPERPETGWAARPARRSDWRGVGGLVA